MKSNCQTVINTVELATAAASSILNATFPGWDEGGITPEMQRNISRFITAELVNANLVEQ